MKSVAVRLALVALFVLAGGVSAYWFWTGESRARHDARAARTFESAAFAVEHGVLDLRAAQQAYVAAGQGDEFWISKAAAATLAVRSALDDARLHATSPLAQSGIDSASSALQDFEQVDRRARDYTRGGQKLLASDLIFADGLEITGAMIASVDHARTAEVQARELAIASARREGMVALGAAAVVGFVVALLLVPVSPAQGTPDRGLATAATSMNLGLTVDRTPFTNPESQSLVAVPSVDLGMVASLCTDLAQVADTRALPAILGRAAKVLDAPGVVLWIADPDGRELSPIVTHGYSQQMVARLGTILRDAENVTASAFRTSLMQTVETDAVSNGAIAAPLITPAGCVGVIAAEVRHRGEKDSMKLAAAAIVAAQLATLVGPPSTRAQARADAM